MVQATEERVRKPGTPIAFDRKTISDEFLGMVVADEATIGDRGEQVFIGIRPIRYNLGGKTGAYPLYIPTEGGKTGSRSKLGLFMASMFNIYGDNAFNFVGAGELVGLVGWWKRTQAEFGRDRQTGEKITSDMFLAIRRATPEEIAEAGAAAENWKTETREDGESATNVNVNNRLGQSPEGGSWSEKDISAVLRVILGETTGTVVSKAATSKLAPNLKAAILGGQMVPYLLSSGVIEEDESGAYVKVEEPETEEESTEPEAPEA